MLTKPSSLDVHPIINILLNSLKITRWVKISQKSLATIVYGIAQVFAKVVVTFCC